MYYYPKNLDYSISILISTRIWLKKKNYIWDNKWNIYIHKDIESVIYSQNMLFISG